MNSSFLVCMNCNGGVCYVGMVGFICLSSDYRGDSVGVGRVIVFWLFSVFMFSELLIFNRLV